MLLSMGANGITAGSVVAGGRTQIDLCGDGAVHGCWRWKYDLTYPVIHWSVSLHC